MYGQLRLQFEDLEPCARLDAEYFNAGNAGTQKYPGKAHLKDFRMRGVLLALEGERHYSMPIRYSGRGACKDVYSLMWRKPEGGEEVRAVMKVMYTEHYGTLQGDVSAVCHKRMEGMVAEQYGLHEEVEVSILLPGGKGRQQLDYTVCVQIEADHGDDVGVAFQKALDQGSYDSALDLWRGAVDFIMEWQFREGGGREGARHHFLKDWHARNICALASVTVIYLYAELF